MTQNGKQNSFLVVQTCALIIHSLGYVIFFISVLVINSQSFPPQYESVILISLIAVISLSVLWGILNVIYTISRRMSTFQCILFWLYTGCEISWFLLMTFGSSSLPHVILDSLYYAGLLFNIGFIYSMKWNGSMLLVKISAIFYAMGFILGIYLVEKTIYGLVIDILTGILGVTHILMIIGGGISLYKLLKSSRLIE